MSELLDRSSIVELLTELGSRLHARNVSVEIYVVGGTAMVLAYDRERLTRDVDAVWANSDSVTEVVEAIAHDRGLPTDWLNDRVRPMLPRVIDHAHIEALVVPGLVVSVASPQHMIAMKAGAARDSRDLDDLALLCGHEGVDSVAEVLEIADSVWGPGMLRAEAVFAVREGLLQRGLLP